MSYTCYLGEYLMPEIPQKLTLKVKNKNKTIILLNEGEINFLRSAGLSEITTSLSFPMYTTTHKPDYYLGILENFKTSKKPFIFRLVRRSPAGKFLYNTDIKVSLEDYTVSEDASRGADVTVDIALKQWREYGTKTVTIKETPKPAASVSAANTTGGASSPSAKIGVGDKIMIAGGAVYGGLYDKTRGMKVPPAYTGKWYTVMQVATHKGEQEVLVKELYSWVAVKYLQKQGAANIATTVTVTKNRDESTAPKVATYTVKKGDTLWGISKKYLGNGAKYTQIYDANRSIISNPNVIRVGQVLTIP